jgi:hypothetical protein
MVDGNNLNFVTKHFPLIQVSQTWHMTFCDETFDKKIVYRVKRTK